MASINNFAEAVEAAKGHEFHDLEIARYGLDDSTAKEMRVYNVAIQCLDCGVVLADWDNPEMGGARNA